MQNNYIFGNLDSAFNIFNTNVLLSDLFTTLFEYLCYMKKISANNELLADKELWYDMRYASLCSNKYVYS